MRATVQDLRDALTEAADRAIAPDGLATIKAVERGVADARRRTVVRVCSLAVAAMGIAGAVALGEGRKDAATPSGPPVSGTLRVVTDDPAFPQYDRGMQRIAVVETPLGGQGSLDLSGVAESGRRLYASRYCTGPGNGTPMLTLASGSQVRYLACQARAELSAGLLPVLWLPKDAVPEVAISTGTADAANGTARIAVYQEVPWDEYRFPARPDDLATSSDYAWTTPPSGLVELVAPADPASPNAPRTVTLPYRERMGVGIEVRGPGTITVKLNGESLYLYCGQPGRIAVCVPDQPVGDTFTTWAYGHADGGIWFDGMPGLEVGKPLTIAVDPSHFHGDDWRLLVGIRDQ